MFVVAGGGRLVIMMASLADLAARPARRRCPTLQ